MPQGKTQWQNTMGKADREKIMRQCDSWRKYIANGGTGSWPRDAFEALLNHFDEIKAKYENQGQSS